MKDPKALFPFLFASSWLGDLLLTILAFFLAFTHDGALTPLLFLTVALCILSGNLLPIGSYLLFIKWRESELKAEAAQASLRVRDALRRSEEVIGRLDEAEGALSKAILIARQLPERISESFKAVEDLSERINTLEVTSFTESLQASSVSIEGLKEETAALQKQVQDLKKDLSALPKTLTKVVNEAVPVPPSSASGEMDVSVGERLDLVYESLEAVQDSLDGLLNRLANTGSRIQETQNEGEPETKGGHEPEPLPAKEVDEDPVSGEVEEEDKAEEDEAIDDEHEFAHEEIEFLEEEDREDSRNAQEEMLLMAESEASPQKPDVAPDKARLSVRAMVGISNRLYIRGDEPWLSWEEGKPMDLVGIGEFVYELENLKESLEVEVLLNDDIVSDAGRITLEPGKVVRISPVFPK